MNLEPCTTWSRRKRHLARSLERDPRYDAGARGTTLCGQDGLDETEANRYIDLYGGKAITVADLADCKKCAKQADKIAAEIAAEIGAGPGSTSPEPGPVAGCPYCMDDGGKACRIHPKDGGEAARVAPPNDPALAVDRWRVRHPGIGVLTYPDETSARTAAGTAGVVYPPGESHRSTP